MNVYIYIVIIHIVQWNLGLILGLFSVVLKILHSVFPFEDTITPKAATIWLRWRLYHRTMRDKSSRHQAPFISTYLDAFYAKQQTEK